jgi:general stress protein YciG
MAKRKRGRTTKAQASSKVRPQAARGGEHTGGRIRSRRERAPGHALN